MPSGRIAVLIALALLSGCGSGPRAPALRDEAVYQNDREGFRFLAPEGWNNAARAEVPPGPLPKERVLVVYRSFDTGKPAFLEVSVADSRQCADLPSFLAAPSFGVERWHPQTPEEQLEVQGAAAIRLILGGRAGKKELLKEVVAFRRGERTYFFTGLFSNGDDQARGQLRQAVASTLWNR